LTGTGRRGSPACNSNSEQLDRPHLILKSNEMVNPTRIFQAGEMAVTVYPNLDEMGQAAAAHTADILIRSVIQNGSARVIIATGNSQLSFIRSLANFERIQWDKITVFHMDEYLGIAADHPASFRRWIHERVEKAFSPKAVHYLNGDSFDAEAECRRYEELLKEAPIDLVCMGIGENGHIAFNDPPVANFADPVFAKVVELEEACRQQQVGEGHFPSLDDVPTHALSLTIPALLSPTHLQVVVPEGRKAEAVRNALEGPISTACPASILRTTTKARLFLDTDSASGLQI
jgi:glucosamine-6-phosphate deaminase